MGEIGDFLKYFSWPNLDLKKLKGGKLNSFYTSVDTDWKFTGIYLSFDCVLIVETKLLANDQPRN